MNVLILTRYNNDGGVVTHVINLANELTKMGHKVVVAAPTVENSDRYLALNCTYVPVDFEGKNIICAIKEVAQIIKKYQIDIIHSHNRNTSFVAEIFKVLYRIPFIWTLHQNNIPHGLIYKLMTFSGNKTITVSSELKEFCVNKLGIKNNKVQVIYNGVHADKYYKYSDEKCREIKNKWNVSENKKVIVLMSRMEERKGHMVLLEALTLLEHKDGYKVLIAGSDLDDGTYRNRMLTYIEDQKLTDNVTFIGYVNPVDVLNISDLFVLPSENEGQPIAVIESFLMKVPVVRTKTGGYEEMKDFCKGIEIGDVQQLAENIDAFLDDMFEEDMIEDAYSFAQQFCTCEAMANKTEEIYLEVLEQR